MPSARCFHRKLRSLDSSRLLSVERVSALSFLLSFAFDFTFAPNIFTLFVRVVIRLIYSVIFFPLETIAFIAFFYWRRLPYSFFPLETIAFIAFFPLTLVT